MQDRTRPELELLKKEEHKRVLEEWNKVNSQATKDGRFGSNAHLALLIEAASEYLDKILNRQ
jgi:hypothetical protein